MAVYESELPRPCDKFMSEDHQPRRAGRSGDSDVQRGPVVILTYAEKKALSELLTEEQLANPHLKAVHGKCLLALTPLYDTMRTPTK